MRWLPWALGIVGVLQHALIVWYSDAGYVSVDFSYLVMFLCIIGAVLACYASCWGCGDWDGGCGCCGDGCRCGDCGSCGPAEGPGNGHAHEHGHEGHAH